MERLLEPIHNWQKASESTHANLHYVYQRWINLHAHLLQFSDPTKFAFAEDIRAYLERIGKHGFEFRLKRQVQDVHLLAYILNPSNQYQWSQFSETNQERVTNYISSYGGADVLIAFFEYISMELGFHSTKSCWAHTNNSKLFWNLAVSIS
jgi:hypothetical protein